MKKARRSGRDRNEDRLSDLPDCILLHILSFLNTKQVVQTCVLSNRWKDVWKHVPTLLFRSFQFKTVKLFRRFVTKVFSGRDGSAALCKLDFDRHGCVEPPILKRIVRYALSHNVQQLRLHIEYDLELPPQIFSCQSLTSLDLSLCCKFRGTALFPKSISMAALTHLHLENFAFSPGEDGRAEPFSNCKMLHTMVLVSCTAGDAEVLSISNVMLANLVIHPNWPFRYCGETVLSTQNLQSFSLTSSHPPKLIGSNLSFLDEVYIDARSHGVESALIINGWLQAFTNVKSMTLSSRTLQVLSLIPDLQKIPHPCFGNLNSFKVLKNWFGPTIPCGILDYFLQNSPSAEVTILNDKGWTPSIGG